MKIKKDYEVFGTLEIPLTYRNKFLDEQEAIESAADYINNHNINYLNISVCLKNGKVINFTKRHFNVSWERVMGDDEI
jgi:hypothetical protein